MIARLITWSVHNRFLVAVLAVVLIVTGAWAARTTPVDALPDLSDTQVIVYTPFRGQAPTVVEEQVTYPLSTALMAVPQAKTVRGFSFFGFSLLYVLFEDGTDLYWARSRVLESLNTAQGRLPSGVTPSLGPDATGVGWVFQYSLSSDRHDLAELRSMQDWYLRYELMALDDVAEVASVGGHVRQLQVELDPERLRALGLSADAVRNAVQQANVDVGGRLLEIAETEFMVRGEGSLSSPEELAMAPIGLHPNGHAPVLLSQVAEVHWGPEIRRGVLEKDGEGEVVGGIVVMRSGANAMEVTQRVRERLEELEAGLPEGVTVHVDYDRAPLIERTIEALSSKLVQQILVVALLCAVFLLHLRSALVAMFVLPAGLLGSFLGMKAFGVGADVMSLGGFALAIGVMVDASIVLVENLHTHKERSPDEEHVTLVLRSAREVGPALFFSLLVVTVSFLPVFVLEAQEGRLFRALAVTKTFAMAAASLLAVTVTPVLLVWFVRGRTRAQDANLLTRLLMASYRPVLEFVTRAPLLVLLVTALAMSSIAIPWQRAGTEFVPPLNEGDLLYMPTTPPGISVTKARELLQQTDRLIAAHPQVKHVVGKAGRADTATDPAPLSMLETVIVLEDPVTWPAGKRIEDIIGELDASVRIPGLVNAWTMPIRARLDMLTTGIRTPVGIKLMGADLEELAALGRRIEPVIANLPETKSVFAERSVGGNYLDVSVKRADAARWGVSAAAIQRTVASAVGGANVGEVVDGLERYPINVRLPRRLRDDLEDLRRVGVPTMTGHTVALGSVADVSLAKGPPAIKSENARRTSWLFIDIVGDDVGGYVERAKAAVAAQVEVPDGVSVVWSGQYEALERASERLRLVVPLTLVAVFLLLFVHFGSATETSIVLLTVPVALIGALWFLDWHGYPLSVAVGVGLIALVGLTVETGVVMALYLDRSLAAARDRLGDAMTVEDLRVVVLEGAAGRVRPVAMTVATDVIGLLPIMFGTETGVRVMQRIVAPMVGGLLTSTLACLVVLPAAWFVWRRGEVR